MRMQPMLLSRGKMVGLLEAATSLKQEAAMSVAYVAGLRGQTPENAGTMCPKQTDAAPDLPKVPLRPGPRCGLFMVAVQSQRPGIHAGRIAAEAMLSSL